MYGTDAYERRLLDADRRAALARIAGDRAERLAYLFCVTPRRPLLAGTHRWARDLPMRVTGGERGAGNSAPTADELDALVLLHMANLAEQASAGDGSPGRWLVRVRDLAELLLDGEAIVPPAFIAQLAVLSDADESRARIAYLEAVCEEREEARVDGLSLAAACCPVVPEPCVWLAFMSRRRGDHHAARSWASEARKRLAGLGTPWDKRLTFDRWLATIDTLEHSPNLDPTLPSRALTHPQALFEAVVPRGAHAHQASRAGATGVSVRPDPRAGRRRFYRYIEALADSAGSRAGAVYPDLEARPWHDASEFPIVGYLESNYPAIRDEILALDATRFHRESEHIDRTGDWDVVFLYERGRRRDEACRACPVTTHGIEAYPTMRTPGGLIYVSRMRPMTHITPHRGPTNLRLRCHLAIKVPTGDCAIRVGDETRRWREGRCLVFDDFLMHEAWNRTDEDRVVLIVDLWHPGLSDTEVMLLAALHNYTYLHAERLGRYWSANAAAARETQSGAA
ncbi:MAG: aspartyl/asparaginyl beta-hydroxylase domain-containing protein [Solirubrobacterales bacterium]|nr:aspartyl/asparaginyl beta-hydroxylase domain-containing protein [Solirubrobacterales bacterium]